MSSIDSRVVEMKFLNGEFANKVKDTLSFLDKLRNAMNFSSSKKGMEDLQASANKLNMGPLSTSVEGVSAKFLALSTIAITALSRIANAAITTGMNLAKSFTMAPIT